MKDHVVFYSGGLASWATAMRVAEKHGTKNLKMLFTDTKMEDEDLYRFLDESAILLGGGNSLRLQMAEHRGKFSKMFDYLATADLTLVHEYSKGRWLPTG